MAIENITMPQLGESVTEGTISKWLVSPGDHVHKYDPLCEVLTDKVNAEVPSSFEGEIVELIASEDETVAVGEVICTVKTGSSETIARPEAEPGLDPDAAVPEPEAEKGKKVRYSPAVLKLSQEYGIDLNRVKGTGREGRITRKDLLKIIESRGNEAEPAPSKPEPAKPAPSKPEPARHTPPASRPQPVREAAEEDMVIPVTGVRKAIANNMARSKQEIPHAWMMVEADVTNLVRYREAVKEEFKRREGFNLTYFAFFVKAVARALKEYPALNSRWAGDAIIQKHDVNISIAVAAEDRLYVPVIKHADEKSIKGIAHEIAVLAQKARAGKLAPEDMEGGTFTVNNTGSFGSVQSMGIINYPQAAILQVESIVKRPVIMEEGMFAARDIVNLCLSIDHRILDGLVSSRFLKRVKEILEAVTPETAPLY
ncbi:dihydrolipoamide acetyltransferase family protein [Heyndrickxia coagulans]|uniref:dihydrolipoamide acetyltransferase family protein n=1 Tax=Heyndrickxia coagulans TaxID=1398 RepID=UPI00105DE435|nr:dihydrolipoamide acetyltransferase family protein [Heyndrickxia coagulans]MBF8419171.1 2-oxo acid dehydrogenase subunit E2 [Heyndrickxia coagulans]